jgi:hypothetical protein
VVNPIANLLTAELGAVVRVDRRLWLVDGTGRAVWPIPRAWPTPLHTPVPVYVEEDGTPRYRAAIGAEKIQEHVQRVLKPSSLANRIRIRPKHSRIEWPVRNVAGEIWFHDPEHSKFKDPVELFIRDEYCAGLRLLAKKARERGMNVELAQLNVGAIKCRFRDPQHQPVVLMVQDKPRAVVMPLRWEVHNREEDPDVNERIG